MRKLGSGTGFSATDLSTFLECAHRTWLDLQVLDGRLVRPGQNEIERRLLERRGLEHEARVLERYESSGRSLERIAREPGAEGSARAAERTLSAMRSGIDVIYQGVLFDGAWSGSPDFLIKVPGGGQFGHHYEVVDAKLARETRARAVLQLCVYTEQLARVQGVTPMHCYIAPGGLSGELIRFRVQDYLAYYRQMRARFEAFVAASPASDAGREPQPAVPYPEPVEFCGVCAFWRRCEERRRADDHLSLVAGISRRQRDRLTESRVTSVAELGALGPERAVEGISREALGRVREQARIQLDGRRLGRPLYELLRDAEPGSGLEALPEATPGDLFLDLEGDAFYRGEGLEYLFGLVDFGEPVFDFSSRDAPGPARYQAFRAQDRPSEKRAFEAVIDRIVRGREEFPALHVFHFGHRERDALARLSCLHRTREREVDRLLREHALVDLYPIVRHALRASVESYTLKELEVLYGFRREAQLRDAAVAMQLFGYWLETAEPELDPAPLRATIERYNREDCLSAAGLRDFLEARRPELERLTGRPLARPHFAPAGENEDRKASNEAGEAVVKRLLAGLPADPSQDGESERARRLMASLVGWHWREAKSGWWEYFRTLELPGEDRLDDRAVLAGLAYEGVVDSVKQSLVHRYAFPEQEHAIRHRPAPVDPATGQPAGEVRALEPGYVLLKRSKSSSSPHPSALIPGKPISTSSHENSLVSIGSALCEDLDAPEHRAARDLLLRTPPRAGQAPGAPLLADGEALQVALPRLALAAGDSVLAVQGPPGSGKTHQAALLIGELVRAGRRVGVTANSHEVIKNVLRKVAELSPGPVRALHVEDDSGDSSAEPFEILKDKSRVRERLARGELELVGGTSWLWTLDAFANSVDVLIVDEAGQVSLANALAVSRAAPSLLLFGDPAQLEQPQKGVHPPGADVSALEHLLGEEDLTIPPDRGVFLPRTRRLHPRICDFVSEVFYSGRLHPEPSLGLERQAIEGAGPLCGAGLRYLPVAHQGNTNQAPEEVDRIRSLVAELLGGSSAFCERSGEVRPLTMADILVVAPYNAQVAALRRVLPDAIKVGTVDRFQGKEAPVVIYSMTTSSASDAPRGLEFLYSLNRLNVAVSRAQALAVLVASPELFQVSCKTPRQMKLVNALCAYLEHARSD